MTVLDFPTRASAAQPPNAPPAPDPNAGLPCKGRGVLFDAANESPAAEWAAKSLCYSCPQLYRCREWAVRTWVSGICGGLNEQEREQWREQRLLDPVEDLTPQEQYRRARRDPAQVLILVEALFDSGMTAPQVAEELEVSLRTVGRWRAALHLPVPAPPGALLTAEEREQIRLDPRNTTDCAKAFGVSRPTVRRIRGNDPHRAVPQQRQAAG